MHCTAVLLKVNSVCLCCLAFVFTMVVYACTVQGIFSPPDPTPGSAFCLGIEARHELLNDIAEPVRQREERKAAEAAGGSAAGGSGSQQQGALHRNVLDYVLADMRTWVSWDSWYAGCGCHQQPVSVGRGAVAVYCTVLLLCPPLSAHLC